MNIFIINYIENFFILWFVLACFGVNIFHIRFIFLVGIATLCALSIQQLHLFNNFAVDSLINSFMGVIFYVYILKISYYKKVKILQCFGYVLIYFVVFIMAAEYLLNSIYHPLYGSNMNKFIYYIPYRLMEIFIILLIQKRKGAKAC